MSLPLVVSDPERCNKNPSRWQPGVWLPHEWTRAGRGNPEAVTRQGLDYTLCRYCGGRKP